MRELQWKHIYRFFYYYFLTVTESFTRMFGYYYLPDCLTEILSETKFAMTETATDFVVLKSVCLSTLTNHSNIGSTSGVSLGRVYLIVQPIMIGDVQLPNKSYFTFEG